MKLENKTPEELVALKRRIDQVLAGKQAANRKDEGFFRTKAGKALAQRHQDILSRAKAVTGESVSLPVRVELTLEVSHNECEFYARHQTQAVPFNKSVRVAVAADNPTFQRLVEAALHHLTLEEVAEVFATTYDRIDRIEADLHKLDSDLQDQGFRLDHLKGLNHQP